MTVDLLRWWRGCSNSECC